MPIQHPTLRGEIDEHGGAEPAELLALPVAERVDALQDEDDDADGQVPIHVLLLADHSPHRH